MVFFEEKINHNKHAFNKHAFNKDAFNKDALFPAFGKVFKAYLSSD